MAANFGSVGRQRRTSVNWTHELSSSSSEKRTSLRNRICLKVLGVFGKERRKQIGRMEKDEEQKAKEGLNLLVMSIFINLGWK